jgi:hypothetical protein
MEAIADVWYSARSVALPKQSELVCGYRHIRIMTAQPSQSIQYLYVAMV